jgi:hypothetical protein
MKLLKSLLKKDRRILRRKSGLKKQQEVLTQIGREQFQTLMDKGLDVPVALL